MRCGVREKVVRRQEKEREGHHSWEYPNRKEKKKR